ncbi:unnamed protein product [Allacma fusca]|uniref:SET domain-containing protein n=1 Tax=Allacma fusca TaxID=39272 RepID=A0A8J2L0K1_9HEXA|nr:unnamed protein product [Allacma fusca]
MQHWFEIKKSEELGRYLVATKDIPARTVILREKPMVCGPADYDQNEELGSIPMCLGCFTRLVDDPDSRCSSCGWPVCGENCEQIAYHAENECELFTKNEIVFPPPHQWPISNKSILILRCYLLKTKRPDFFKDLLQFEDHNDIRKKKQYCINGDAMVLENMKYFLKDPDLELSEDEADEFLRISGIINVNAFTTMKEAQQRVTIVQCMFAIASLFAHSCVPNANWSIGDPPDLTMTIRTAMSIKKGEMITIPYSVRDNLCGTLQRLISTEDVAHFSCKCPRCEDPTEFGTAVSGIKCPTPSCQGYLLPVTSSDVNSVWKCRKIDGTPGDKEEEDVTTPCEFSAPVRRIVPILNKVDTRIEMIKKDFESLDKNEEIVFEALLMSLESLREDCEKIFHKNHYLIQEICLFIIKKRSKGFDMLGLRELEVVINHCEYLLEIANVLNPGYSGHRAMLQFYLSRALHFKARQLKILQEEKLMMGEERENEHGEILPLEDISKCGQIISELDSQIEALQREAFLYFDFDPDED